MGIELNPPTAVMLKVPSHGDRKHGSSSSGDGEAAGKPSHSSSQKAHPKMFKQPSSSGAVEGALAALQPPCLSATVPVLSLAPTQGTLGAVAKTIKKKCEHGGCTKKPSFNSEGLRKAKFCAKHKLKGMLNVRSIRCEHNGCSNWPIFKFEGEEKYRFCVQHKEEGMVRVRNTKCCEHPGCDKTSAFNFEGERKGRFCAKHKLNGMLNVTSIKCEHDGCSVQASFNSEGQRKVKFCVQHKLEGMVSTRRQQNGARQNKQKPPTSVKDLSSSKRAACVPTLPEQLASREAAPTQAAAFQAAPEKATPALASHLQALPGETAPVQVAPLQAEPGAAVPAQRAPRQADITVQAPLPQERGFWECPACTLHNEADASICAVCLTPSSNTADQAYQSIQAFI